MKSMNRLNFKHVKMTLCHRKRECAFFSYAYKTFYTILSNNMARKKPGRCLNVGNGHLIV